MMAFRYKLVRDYEAERQDRIDAAIQKAIDNVAVKIAAAFARRRATTEPEKRDG
jgi:hypothetical protein